MSDHYAFGNRHTEFVSYLHTWTRSGTWDYWVRANSASSHKIVTTFLECAWPQQCWKSCVNVSNFVALPFSNHGTQEMLGICWFKSWTSFKLCTTTPNNMQQGMQMYVTCNIQPCWELLANNVVSVIDVYEMHVVSICTELNGSVLLPCNHLLFGSWSLFQVNGIERLKNYNIVNVKQWKDPFKLSLIYYPFFVFF